MSTTTSVSNKYTQVTISPQWSWGQTLSTEQQAQATECDPINSQSFNSLEEWTASTGLWMWSSTDPTIQKSGGMRSSTGPWVPPSAANDSTTRRDKQQAHAPECDVHQPIIQQSMVGWGGGGWTAEAKNPHKGQVPTDMETITERCQRGYQPERPGKMAAVHHLQTEYWPLPSALLLAPPEDLSHQRLSKWNMSPRSQTHHAELPYQCTWKNMPASIWDRVEGQATRINWGARNHSPVHQEHQHLYLCHDHRTFEWRRRRRAASTVSWMWSSTAYEKQDEHRLMDVIFNSSWFNSLEI